MYYNPKNIKFIRFYSLFANRLLSAMKIYLHFVSVYCANIYKNQIYFSKTLRILETLTING